MIAGATDAPITAVLLVFEMTNDYGLVLPLMITVVLAHAVARRFEPDSLYSGWLRRRGESIVHGADRDVLAGVLVRDAYEPSPRVIPEDAPLPVLLDYLAATDQPCFPVVDAAQRLVGVITVTELGRLAAEVHGVGSLIRAVDVAEASEVVAPTDSLYEAVRQMGVRGVGALPVVDPSSGRIFGLITRGHIVTAYDRGLASLPADGGVWGGRSAGEKARWQIAEESRWVLTRPPGQSTAGHGTAERGPPGIPATFQEQGWQSSSGYVA